MVVGHNEQIFTLLSDNAWHLNCLHGFWWRFVSNQINLAHSIFGRMLKSQWQIVSLLNFVIIMTEFVTNLLN